MANRKPDQFLPNEKEQRKICYPEGQVGKYKAECRQHLEMSHGTTVRAWRSRRRVAGKEPDVVVFSPQLYQGQLRGLHQHAVRVSEQLEAMGLHPHGTPEAAGRRIAKSCGHQYLRKLIRYEVVSGALGRVQVRLWSDLDGYRRLEAR